VSLLETLFHIQQFRVESFSWRMTSLSEDLFLFHLVVHSIVADGMMVPENWTVLFLPHNSQCIIHQSYYSGLCTVNSWKYHPVSHENSNKSPLAHWNSYLVPNLLDVEAKGHNVVWKLTSSFNPVSYKSGAVVLTGVLVFCELWPVCCSLMSCSWYKVFINRSFKSALRWFLSAHSRK
jgi:hypothetical protein